MSTVHPQHLVLRRAESEAAPVMETDEKRGLSPKMGPPRICILEVFTLLFFLASTRRCCHVFPGPDFWHTSHSRSLVTVTETQRTQQRAVSCSRLSDLQSLEAFTTLQYLQIEYPLTLLCPYFEQPQTTKKANHPRPKSQFQTNEV